MKRLNADHYLFKEAQRKTLRPPFGKLQGFSLLEVILATVVLAGSAMVLTSMLGQGAKFGSRAELKATAITAAQSVLDEFLAMPIASEQQSEVTGAIEGPLVLGYRIRHEEARLGGRFMGQGSAGLRSVTVEIFSGEIGSTGNDQEPLCTLSRLALFVPTNRGADDESEESSRRHGSVDTKPEGRSYGRSKGSGRLQR